MAEFTRYKDSSPIIKTQPIATTAQGDAAISSVIGGAANMLTQTIKKMHEEQSSAMALHAMSEANDLKQKAAIEIMQNPNPSSVNEVVRQAKVAGNALVDSAMVTDNDRGRLEYSVHNALGSLEVEAQKSNLKFSRGMAAMSFYEKLPQVMSDYQEALIRNPEQAEYLQNKMSSTVKGMVATGAMTPKQAISVFQMKQSAMENASQTMAMFGNKDATPQEYQALSAKTNGNAQSIAGTPADAHTQTIQQHHLDDLTFNGVKSSIMQGNLTLSSDQLLAISNMPNDNRMKLYFSRNGVADAIGIINANSSQYAVQGALDELKSKGPILGLEDQAKKDYLEWHQSQLKDKQYYNVQSRTSLGQQAINNFNHQQVMNNSAIENGIISREQGAIAAKNIYNNHLLEMRTLGEGQHVPASQNLPIPDSVRLPLQSMLDTTGADPMQMIQVIGMHDKQTVPLLAKTMRTPLQQEAVSTVGQILNQPDKSNFSTTVASDILLASSGTGVNESVFKVKGTKTDATIKTDIQTSLGDILQYRANIPSGDPMTGGYVFDGAQRQQAITDMAIKYVNLRAARDQDFTRSKYPEYLRDFKDTISKSYNLVQGPDYSFNGNTMPFPTDQAPILAMYMHDVVGEEASNVNVSKGIPSAQLLNNSFATSAELFFDLSPVLITMTDDQRVLATSKATGKVLKDFAYTDSLMSAAKEHYIKKIVEPTRELIKESEGLERVTSPFSAATITSTSDYQSGKVYPVKKANKMAVIDGKLVSASENLQDSLGQ